MRWRKPNLNSIYNLWGQGHAQPRPIREPRTEAIRRAMLQAVPAESRSGPEDKVFTLIHNAHDIKALWFARSELMAVIALEHGEAVASEQVAEISRLFDGFMPGAQRKRQFPG